MYKINEIIADNIIYLRKANKMTQADFALKLNYSDKTVSKWETGSIIPSIETLIQIADVFKIPVDYLLTPHLSEKDRNSPINKTINARNKILIIALMVTIVWSIAAVIYLASIMLNYSTADPNNNPWWKVFLWAIPFSFLAIFIGMRKWFKTSKKSFIFLSAMVWTILIASFFTFTDRGLFWPLFFIGVPVQIAIIIYSKLK